MTDKTAGTALVIQDAPGSLDEVVEQNQRDYSHAARGAYARNTERAYLSDSAIYTAWCQDQGARSVPASPETVVAFIDAMAERKAPGTVRRYVATISQLHRAAGFGGARGDHAKGGGATAGGSDNPTRHVSVALALKRMHRAKGRRQKQAHGITYELRGRMLKATGERLIDKRDRALLAFAYDTGCRRSEIVGFEVEEMQLAPDGSATVMLRRSKTDQEGEGTSIALPADTTALVIAWLEAARITSGRIFRSVARRGKGEQAGEPLAAESDPGRAVARIFRKMAEQAGIDSEIVAQISGHSTRVGMAQDLTASGFDLPAIMKAGRWKTAAMPARYSERQEAKRGAMMKLAAMQGRV